MNGEGEPIVTPAPIGQTVGDILRLLMPEGTNSNRVNPDWSAPPDLPSVFGAAAYLIKISGISIYIDPHAMHSGESTEDQRTEFFSPNRKFYEKLEKTCRKIRKRLKKIRDCNNRIEALIPDEKQTQKMSQQEYDERWNEIEKIKADLGSVFFDAKQLVYEYIEPLWRDLWKHEDDWINMIALNADTI